MMLRNNYAVQLYSYVELGQLVFEKSLATAQT